MTESEIIIVVDHKKRGGRIQGKDGLSFVTWTNYLNPTWDFSLFEYRIHPEEQAIISHFNSGGEIQYVSIGSEVETPKSIKRGIHVDPYEFKWKGYKYRIKPIEEATWNCNVCGKLNTGDGTFCKWKDEHYKTKIEIPEGDSKTQIPIEVPKEWSEARSMVMENDYYTLNRMIMDKQNEFVRCFNEIVERMN